MSTESHVSADVFLDEVYLYRSNMFVALLEKQACLQLTSSPVPGHVTLSLEVDC